MAQIRLVDYKNNTPLILKNDIIEQKARLLQKPVKLFTGYRSVSDLQTKVFSHTIYHLAYMAKDQTFSSIKYSYWNILINHRLHGKTSSSSSSIENI